jgi:general nucleoside transport system permease protein
MPGAGAWRSIEAVALSGGAIVVALFAYGLFIALNGINPFAVYGVLYLGAFGTWFSLEATLTLAAPLMLTGLCTAIPARAGLLVIGAEGALVFGGIAAVLMGVGMGKVPSLLGTSIVGTALVLLAGALAGGLWIALAGALRLWRGVNETISTLLFNYIAIAILNHLISGPIRDFGETLKATSWPIPLPLRIGALPHLDVHWGLAIGCAACLMLWVIMRRTSFGFAVAVLGGNIRAAQVAGLPTARLMMLACLVGGATAGLAGAIEVVAVHGAASESLVVGFGYAGILVAFLARHNPAAIIPVAILVGGISASGGLLQRRFDLPGAATAVLQGCIFLAVLVANTLYGRWQPRSS